MECSKPKKIIIAIDGFSSCGKSTFAKTIAAKLGYIFIDTGAMYRAVTLYALEHGAIVSGIVDEEKVIALLDDISIDFRFNPERGASDIYVNGDRAEGRIRTIEVSNCVSRVSSIRQVREKLVAIVDRNGLQIDGCTADVCDPGDMRAKFEAFGWDVHEVDGHDIPVLVKTLAAAKADRSGRPHAVIARTVKGKGVSFMENQAGWHGKAPNGEQTKEALAELAGRTGEEVGRD